MLETGNEVAIVHGLHAELSSINTGSGTVLFDVKQQLLDGGV